MRVRFSPILWILMAALVTQGALPGVVACLETTGQVEFESIKDECCDGDASRSGQPSALVTTLPGPEPTGSCGPCTDALVSPTSVTKPARNGNVSAGALPCTVLVFDASAEEVETCSVDGLVAANTTLVSIKTITLLI